MSVRWCVAIIVAVACACSATPTSVDLAPSGDSSAATMPMAGPDRAPSQRSRGSGPLLVHEPELISAHAKDRWDCDLRCGGGTVVVGWDARVTAVWYRGGRLWASQRTGPGAWSEQVAVSERFSLGLRRFDVAAGPGRFVSVVWTSGRGRARQVREAHLQGDEWSSPTTLGRGDEPQVAVDGRGETSVIWYRSGVGAKIASRTSSGQWAVQHFPGDGSSYLGGALVVADRAGNEAAMWSPSSPGAPHLWASYRPASSTTWPPAKGVPGPPGVNYSLAFTGGGDVLAAWDDYGMGSAFRDGSTGTWFLRKHVKMAYVDNTEENGVGLVSDGSGNALAFWNQHVFRWTTESGFGPPRRSPGNRLGAMLTKAGTAVVAVAEPLGYRWQRPGRRWSPARSLGEALGEAHDPWTSGARGRRMAVLYSNTEGLHAVLITERARH